MRRPGIEPTCAICDVELHDDPHWHDGLELFYCADCCPNEGCLNLPSDGFVPDDTVSPATDDPGATRSTGVPVAGDSLGGVA